MPSREASGGQADAYTIGLGITFGAQYRFSTNGGPSNSWQGLDDRDGPQLWRPPEI